MAIIEISSDGRRTVIVPPTPEETAQANAALLRFIEALARLNAQRDFEAAQAARLRAHPADPPAGE